MSSCMMVASASERRRIAHVAFVELDIFFGQVRSINNRSTLPEVEVDVQIKFFRRNRRAQFLETGLRRLAALEAPDNAPAPGRAVTDIHFLLDDPRWTVT